MAEEVENSPDIAATAASDTTQEQAEYNSEDKEMNEEGSAGKPEATQVKIGPNNTGMTEPASTSGWG